MSEKFDNLFNELKSRHLISLYYNRVMFYDEGAGEIQFWNLEEISETVLCLKNKGVWVFFDRWEISETPTSKSLHVFNGELEAAEFKFPNEIRIAVNHNYFYIEQFAAEMSAALQQVLPQKGDWADCSKETVMNGINHNFEKINDNTDVETFRKSCVDLANFAAMAYYLVDTWRENV